MRPSFNLFKDQSGCRILKNIFTKRATRGLISDIDFDVLQRLADSKVTFTISELKNLECSNIKHMKRLVDLCLKFSHDQEEVVRPVFQVVYPLNVLVDPYLGERSVVDKW